MFYKHFTAKTNIYQTVKEQANIFSKWLSGYQSFLPTKFVQNTYNTKLDGKVTQESSRVK